jgi:hypothetical protein
MEKLLVEHFDQRLKCLTGGYRERMNRLAIFDPLYELGRKSGRDQRGNPIDWFSLGFLALLFFFESMLTRRRQTSVRDLAQYLHSLNRAGPIMVDELGFQKLAREIVDTFRDASGKRKEKVFYNWETARQETIYYSLLEVRESDLTQNIQYYTLTERGLELVFATKEYFAEFHLSINQLVLRKQLEKGELNSALREIDEMRVAVEELRRKMRQLNNEVQRNIISHETQQRYMKILDDTHARLAREHEEFNELQAFVGQTKRKLEYEMESEKERLAYSLLIQISRELDTVHHLHRTLLDDSITLKRKALQAARESLYHAGLTAFNFNQDLTSRMVTSPLPTMAVQGLMRPFARLSIIQGWSPMEAFAPQKTIKGTEDEDDIGDGRCFLVADTTALESSFYAGQRRNFRLFSRLVRQLLGERRDIRLSEVLEALGQSEEHSHLPTSRSFFEFWLLLHQISPLRPQATEPDERSHLAGEIISAFADMREVDVQEETQILVPTERYRIQEMRLTVRV